MKKIIYNENIYHINKLPESNHKKNDFILSQEKTFLFFKKNVHDIEIISQIRSFFSNLRQPSETDVRQAMLLIIDEDYALKSGGESMSDHIFSSSFKWLQADPKTGLDIEPILIKKYSKNFKDVLITLEEIEFLIENTLTEPEKEQKRKSDIESMVGFLVHSIKTGKYNSDIKKRLTFTNEVKNKVLSKIKDLNFDNYATIFINKMIKRVNEYSTSFRNGNNAILDGNNEPNEGLTKDFLFKYDRVITIYNDLLLIFNE